MQINCGQCIGCRLERARQWTSRIQHETQLHSHSYFATLTYRDQDLPPHGALRKKDPQLFFKRLRHRFPGWRIRYFLCGEYGDSLLRPHYHAIIWGPVLTAQLVEELWKLGYCSLAPVTVERAAYVAKYSLKKITGDRAKAHYSRTDPGTGEVIQLPPEYAQMSLRPGIASEWFNRYKSDLYPSDFVVFRDQKMRVPRYYDSKLSELELDLIKAARKNRAKQFRANNTPERLRVREEVAQAKIQLAQRRNLDRAR